MLNKKFTLIIISVILIPNIILGNVSGDKFDMSQIYSIDRGHSYIGFSVKYMGYGKVKGRFASFSGTIRYDDNDITRTSATVIINTESIDTDLDWRDNDLRSPQWFEAETYPTIMFQSKGVVKTNAGIEVIGNLTIKNTTKEVKLKLEETSGLQKDVRGDSQVFFVGSTTINRKDFGVEGERWSKVKEGIIAVAYEIDIELNILGKRINAPNFKNWVKRIETPQGHIYKTISENGLKKGMEEFHKMKSEDKVKVNSLNTVGYMLLKEGKVDEAVKVFKENVDAYPDSPDVYDSLGEAYAVKGDKKNAVKYYKIALEKNHLNANAMEILKHLKN